VPLRRLAELVILVCPCNALRDRFSAVVTREMRIRCAIISAASENGPVVVRCDLAKAHQRSSKGLSWGRLYLCSPASVALELLAIIYDITSTLLVSMPPAQGPL